MTIEQMVAWLRSVVNIDASGTVDTEYLAMTDAEIEAYIYGAMVRQYPSIPSLSFLPQEDVAVVLLQAKIDLYYTLAGRYAIDVDSETNQNNRLDESQRFDHYLDLIKAAQEDLDNLDSSGGTNGVVTAYDAVLDKYCLTQRNYDKAIKPTMVLAVDSTTTDSISISWSVILSQFMCYRLYISPSQIIDEYSIPNIPISELPYKTIYNSRQTKYRFSGLDSGNTYHIAVVAIDLNGLAVRGELTATVGAGS